MKWLVLVFFLLGVGFFVYDNFRSKPEAASPTRTAQPAAREGDYCGPGLAAASHPSQQQWLGIKIWVTASAIGAPAAPFYLAKPVMVCNLSAQRLNFDRIELSCDDPGDAPDAIVAETVYFSGDQQYQVNHHPGARAPINGTPTVMTVEPGRAMTFDSLDIDCAVAPAGDRATRTKLALFVQNIQVASSGSVALPAYRTIPGTKDVWRGDEEIERGKRGALVDFALTR